MMNIEPDASHTPDVLRDVLGEIETLRNIRQEEDAGCMDSLMGGIRVRTPKVSVTTSD